ncbi:MAG: VOC family protein [Myxococcota bacterium]
MSHKFVWYELATDHLDAAPAFYASVIGWRTQKWDEHSEYSMWVAPAGPIGGLMRLPESAKAMGAPPHWLAYVEVADVDAGAARVAQLGGKVYVPPTDLAGSGGRFAVVADPSGAVFGIHKSGMPDAGPRPEGLGQFVWAELATGDLDQALGFYGELFGWVKAGAIDMPGGAVYQMFGEPGQPALGGMMQAQPGMPVAWLHYASVADIDAALAAATAGGGKVLYGPMAIPGGGHAGLCLDPWGAAFGLVSGPTA